MDEPNTDAGAERLKEAKLLNEHGRCEEARAIFAELIEQGLQLKEAKLNYGVSLMREKRRKEAAEYFIAEGNDIPEMAINASVCYSELGDEDGEYIALKRVLASHQTAFIQPYSRLATIARKREDKPILYLALKQMFDIDPENFGICFELGMIARDLRKLKQGVTFLLKSLELEESKDQRGNIYGILAGLYKDAGEQMKAVHYFRKCYEESPSRNTASNLIMTMQYTHGISFEDFYNQCREYSARFLRHLPRFQFPASRYDPKKPDVEGLRIGFIGGDFVLHSLSNLMLEPIRELKNVRKTNKIFLYSTREKEREDDVADRYKERVDRWQCVHGMSDKEIARKIFDDEIDVLVELAGHTALNALPVFGYKPAPLQIGWISGMMTPPAIETINYFITDEHVVPECAKEICFEKLLPITSSYSYFPLTQEEISPELPADRNGYVTFGSFNNPCKFSSEVLETWAKCVLSVPKSKMHIKVFDVATETHIRKSMAKSGVGGDRLHFIYPLKSNNDVMKYYTQNIDIMLDTWPCAGCLTTAEAMWMGCPSIVLRGETFLNRQSWTILAQLGYDDMGADTIEDYVKAAAKVAEDRPLMRRFREEIRVKFAESGLQNAEKIARDLIVTIQSAWADWCDSRRPLLQFGGVSTNTLS